MPDITSVNKVLFTGIFTILILFGFSTNAGEHGQGSGFKVGILVCESIPGSRVNLVIHSTADVRCAFDNNGTIERYIGETGIALGLDISIKQDEKIAFTVLAASSDIRPGSYSLAGKYLGGQASAAAGIGLGARILVGAGDRNFSLQPLALETSTGLGASAGIGFLNIEADR